MNKKKPFTLTKQKAALLLRESSEGKRKLSPAQRGLFELIAHGRKPKRLSNPRMVTIAPRVDSISYSFGDPPVAHGDCDAECKKAGHRYVHDFDKDFPLCWDTATGRLLI